MLKNSPEKLLLFGNLNQLFQLALLQIFLLTRKGPSTHDEEFADEYSTNIRRRRICKFN